MKKKSKISSKAGQRSKLYKDARDSAGFTLLEIMLVMAILVFVGFIVGSIVMSILRGTNKTNTLTQVRQNGSYAISQISKMLRNSKSFEGVSVNGSGGSYTTNCVSSTKYNYIKIKSFDEGETTFACCASPNTIASLSGTMTCGSSDKYILLDTNTVTVDECYFQCIGSDFTEPPRIDIYFSLRADSSSLFAEKRASDSAIPFSTTVILRNVVR